MKPLFIRFIILIFFLLLSGILFAQSQKADSLKIKAEEFFYTFDFKRSSEAYREAYETEKLSPKPRKKLLAEFCEMLANTNEMAENFDSVLKYYDLAEQYYREEGDFKKTATVIRNTAKFYFSAVENDYPISIPYRNAEITENYYFAALKVLVNEAVDKNKTVKVLVNGGLYDGIYEGAKGLVYGVESKDFENRHNVYLGDVTVLELTTNTATIIFQPVDSTNPFYKICEGDIVMLPCRVESRNYKSIFAEITKSEVVFIDINRNYIYHRRQFLYGDSPELEKELFLLLMDDVKETYEMIRLMTADYPNWTEPINEGRFKGISMIEAMGKSTEEDLLAFLQYVKFYAGSYMGSPKLFADYYASWILANSPVSSDEIRDALLAAKKDDKFNKIADDNKALILNEGFFTKWQGDAEVFSSALQPDKAMALINVLVRVAEHYGDKDLTGWALFSKSAVLYDMQKYEETADALNKSIVLFREVKNLMGESYSLNNLARAKNAQNKYEEAFEGYDASVKLKLIRAETDSSEALFYSIALSMTGKANCLKNLSRFDEAIVAYEQSIEYYQKAGTIAAINQQSTIVESIAIILRDQGKYDEAIVEFEKYAQLCRELGDKGGEAGSVDHIAYTYSLKGENQKANELYKQAYEMNVLLGRKNNAGFSKSNQAQTFWTLGDYNKAIEAHLEAIELRKISGNLSGQADSWKKLGSLYKDASDPQKAEEAYEKALDIYKQQEDKKEEAGVYNEKGDLYYNLKDNKKAIFEYNRALKIYESLSSGIDIANIFLDLGNTYYQDKNYGKAEEFFLKSLEMQEKIGDNSGMVYNLVNLGLTSQVLRKDLDMSEKYYVRALDVAEATGSKYYVAYSKAAIGAMHYNKGDYDKAFEIKQEALNIYREIEDKGEETRILIDLGFYMQMKGKFDESEKYYKQAIEIAEKTNNRTNIATAYSSLSQGYRLKGKFAEAFELEQKSLAISEEVQNLWGMASSYIILGNTNSSMGEYETAIQYYNKSDSIYQIMDWESARATPINNIGNLYFLQNDNKKALEYFFRAHKILMNDITDVDFMSLLKANIGEVYFEMKDYENSKKWLEDAMNISKDIGSSLRHANNKLAYAKLLIAQEKYEEAKQLLDEIYNEFKDSEDYAMVIEVNFILGKLYYLTKENSLAKGFLLKSIDISHQTGTKKHIWESLHYLGLIQYDEKETEAGINSMKEAVDVIEYIKNKVAGGEDAQKLFSADETILKVYEDIIDILTRENHVEEALQYLERGNRENLKSKLDQVDPNFKDTTKTVAVLKEKEMKSKVEQVEEELQKEKMKPIEEQNKNVIKQLEEVREVAQSEYISFVNDIVKEQPSLRNYFSKSENPVQFRAQKKFIPDDMAVLLYLLSNDNLYIFAGTKDTVFAMAVKADKRELQQKIYDFYNMLRNPGFEIPDKEKEFKKTSEELYNLLIEPVRSKISDKKKLAIIPNGVIYYLPFQVLGTTGEDDTFNYLLNDFTIFYSNRLSYLTATFMDEDTVLKLLAIGNTDNSLPFAEDEVRMLSDIYSGSKTLVGSEATKENVLGQQDNYNVLHFATHGMLDYSNFENSYLLLAKDSANGDDGKLHINDIWSINNIDNCQMVTLSACQTAFTLQMLEGWPVTTASAFLEAGVPTVIASLWSVDDKATSLLMDYFYNNLKTMNKCMALHNAQQKLASQEQYKHPFFWAPFVLVGNWR